MIGLPIKNIIGKNPEQVFSKENAAAVREVDNLCFKGHRVNLVKKMSICGKECFYRTVQMPLYDQHKKIIGIGGIVIDMTVQVKAEKENSRTTAMLKKIINDNPYSVQIADANGHTVVTNKAFQRIFGSVPPPEYSTFTDPLLIKAGYRKKLQDLKKGKAFSIAEINYDPHLVDPRVPSKNTYGRATFSPLMGPDGKLEYLLIMHEDITARKKAEDELQKYKAHLEYLVKERTAEVENKVAELERFNKIAVGRELKMIELKEKIKWLEEEINNNKIKTLKSKGVVKR
jgi:PAS domain-containing protein